MDCRAPHAVEPFLELEGADFGNAAQSSDGRTLYFTDSGGIGALDLRSRQVVPVTQPPMPDPDDCWASDEPGYPLKVRDVVLGLEDNELRFLRGGPCGHEAEWEGEEQVLRLPGGSRSEGIRRVPQRTTAGSASVRDLVDVPPTLWSRVWDADLDEWLELGTLSSLQALVDGIPDGGVVEIPPGEYTGSLHIRTRRHLTIRAVPGTVWLVQDDDMADVLAVSDSQDILIDGLGVYHRTSGKCTGDGVVIHNSRHVTIRNCDVSGSGVVGVDVSHAADIVLEGNHIHHCTEIMVSAVAVYALRVVDNLFRENERVAFVDEQGVSLTGILGTGEIAGNTFVNNRCTPITLRNPPLEEELPGPFGAVLIRENVFVASRSPDRPHSIYDAGAEGDWYLPAMEHVSIEDNCFEKTQDLTDIADHVAPGGTKGGNRVGHMVLTDTYQVEQQPACVGRGASPKSWLDAARDPE